MVDNVASYVETEAVKASEGKGNRKSKKEVAAEKATGEGKRSGTQRRGEGGLEN